MNAAQLERICGPGRVSVAPEHRLTYSRDASRISGECLGVIWPVDATEVAELTIWARREGIDLIPRGAGTGLCGGATPQSSLVIDFSRMNGIPALDVVRRHVCVGPGVVLETLNRLLAGAGLCLPVIPGSHSAATVGGMIATDAAGLRAVRHGSMRRWTERVTLIDGLGRRHELAGEHLADTVGREGASGFVVEAVLRLTELPRACEVIVQPLQSEQEALDRASQWLADPELTALEYLNSLAAAAIGWPAQPHLMVERETDRSTGDSQHAAALWAARDGLYPVLAQGGHPMIEDPQLDQAGLAKLLPWLAAEGVPVFGHLGAGIIHPCFRTANDPLIAELYARVNAAGGRVSGEHGVGLKKRRWAGSAWQSQIRRLKGAYDPEHVINRGQIC